MATLHVRNVPDPLYEALRDRAAGSGRSISGEALMILGAELGPSALLVGERMGTRTGRRGPTSQFERFTPRARNVVLDAREAADKLGAPAIGTDHLLLALMHAPDTIASWVLGNAGLDYVGLFARLEAEFEPEGEERSSLAGTPLTPGTKHALELALRACINQRSLQIQPEHLLLGIAQEGSGPGAQILRDAGLAAEEVLRAVTAPRRVEYGAPRFEPATFGFRVLQLAGEASQWEQELNSYAARGYELVEIVGDRAIFAVRMSDD